MVQRKTRVMRLIARLNVGGPALHCLLLSQKLSEHGFETTLVTGSPEPGEACYETLFGVETIGFRMVRLPKLRRTLTGLGDLRTFLTLVRLMRQERPDIVHTHTAKAGVLGRLAAFVAGVPVVVHTFHGHVLSGYFGKTMSLLVRWVEKALAWRTTAIVTLSPALKEELSGRFKIAPPSRFEIIPLGRNLSSFFSAERGALRRELGIAENVQLMGIIGRLVPIKDHATLFRACAQLNLAKPWCLLVVGEGELGESLRRLSKELGLADKVRFLGWRSDLAQIYADLDCMVLSSLNEGTPLSIVESFASGCPVIATAVGGVADMFHPSARPAIGDVRWCAEGAVVPSQNSSALVAAFTEFFSDAELRLSCRKAARLAAEGYSDDILVNRVAALYRKLQRPARERIGSLVAEVT